MTMFGSRLKEGKKKRSRFSDAPPVKKEDDEEVPPPPGVVHVASLGGKTKEADNSAISQGIDFNSLPCTTYPSFDTYEAKKV